MPECSKEIITIEPSKEFIKLEEEIVLEGKLTLGAKEYLFDKLTKPLKLKQLTGGFIYLKEDEGRLVYRLKENSKLEAALEILNLGRKTIIFYQFQEEGDILAEALKKEKMKFVEFKGGLTAEERMKREHSFQNNPETLCSLTQIQAGSEGWDGYAAGIIIFYDIVSSPKLLKQCIGRMHRSGQTKKTVVYELIMRNTINEITKSNQDGRKSEVEEYMEYVQKFKFCTKRCFHSVPIISKSSIQ